MPFPARPEVQPHPHHTRHMQQASRKRQRNLTSSCRVIVLWHHGSHERVIHQMGRLRYGVCASSGNRYCMYFGTVLRRQMGFASRVMSCMPREYQPSFNFERITCASQDCSRGPVLASQLHQATQAVRYMCAYSCCVGLGKMRETEKERKEREKIQRPRLSHHHNDATHDDADLLKHARAQPRSD